jgi:hypothetical protein
MKKFDMRILWGGLLIAAGALFLMQELGWIPSAWGIIWGLAFGIAGCVFLYAFLTDRTQWWPIIPGLGLLSLGVLILVEDFFPGIDWAGAIFLGGIGLSFWIIYLINKENWWAVIPGGVLVTLALVAGLEPYLSGDADGGIFMLGLGATFGLVGILPTPQGRMKWAFIPALVLLIIGFFLLSPALPLLAYIWPVALILLGLYFVVRNFRS